MNTAHIKPYHDIQNPKPLLKGLDATVFSWAGAIKRSQSQAKELADQSIEIDQLSERYKDLKDEQLKERLKRLSSEIQRARQGYQSLLSEALALLRISAFRCLGLWPYRVQMIGALAIYKGYLIEMSTGEGKTLTASLAAVLNAWSKRPCHIVTVNDYLAARDAQNLADFYHFCGATVSYVVSSMNPEQRREAYQKDITYTTSKELVADFLRDRIVLGKLQNPALRRLESCLRPEGPVHQNLVMRGLHSAIIDEADSVLIDEAVTPLIISEKRPNEAFLRSCKEAEHIASQLSEGQHYEIDYAYKDVQLKEGWRKGLLSYESGLALRENMVSQALMAKHFYHLNQQYIIKDKKLVLIDEFTGRMMPQRSWQAGLHQMVEAKEQLPLSEPTETIARLSFQRFFRFYHKLSGMSGTALEAKEEFWQIYGLAVIKIPEHKPCQRVRYPAQCFAQEEDKWQAIKHSIQQIHEQGRPILIGTRSIEKSQMLAEMLKDLGYSFQLLNALHHEQEAKIIEQAGKASSITIATNMAGRGTDILLDQQSRRLGGLHVIGTEASESKRIDRQLFGRAARQGDPGSAQLFFSREDELFRRYVPIWLQKKIQNKGAKLALKFAQRKSQSRAYQSRKSVLKMDTWLEDSLSFALG